MRKNISLPQEMRYEPLKNSDANITAALLNNFLSHEA